MPAPTRRPAIIQTQGLWRVYLRGQEKVEALRGVNLEIQPGSFSIIFGPSGGGKSTLLHLLGGMDQPTSGSLTVNGTQLHNASESALTRFRRESIGVVFQFYNLLPSINALENTALPLLARGMRRTEALQRAGAELDSLGMRARALHRPDQLSGGEQQRVAIARAIVGRPAIVLADEPTGDLDADTADEILHLMRGINQRMGITFVIATHNNLFQPFADNLFELRSGELKKIALT